MRATPMPSIRSAALCLLLLGLACAEAEESILATGTKLYSQHDEELLIRDFFRDRRGGFFLDVGAYHWKKSSTTLYLEKHLGWTGIAIDAQAAFAPGYAKHRPGTRFFAYIVTDHSASEETLYAAGPISSTVKSHVEDVARKFGVDPDPGLELEQWKVPAITLNELLDREGVTRIDFLSMDIEQGEPAALAGFDIERFRPELVCIEAFEPIRDQISAYFERHGYERIDRYLEYDDLNWYYTPRK